MKTILAAIAFAGLLASQPKECPKGSTCVASEGRTWAVDANNRCYMWYGEWHSDSSTCYQLPELPDQVLAKIARLEARVAELERLLKELRAKK